MARRLAYLMWKRACALLVLCFACSALAWAVPLKVVYPRISERSTDSYGYKVLALALDKSGIDYQLSLSNETMNQERARRELEAGRVSAFDTGTSPEMEQRFDAVYFPIDLGLSGYRLMIVPARQEARWRSARRLADLRGLVAGQGPGWADIRILEQAGFSVVTGPFESLFKMVNAGRFDFLPLGAEETDFLLQRYSEAAPDCVVARDIALHYPFARLIFVTRGNAALHHAIAAGLERAYRDGSLFALLKQDTAFRAVFDTVHLERRTIIELPNPNLTERFRAMPEQYFYHFTPLRAK